MVEISLECAIVGQIGSFDVTIDDGKKVSVLKDAIKAEIDYSGPAKDLKLSLAKKGAGWLPSAELRAIRKGEDVPGFERVSLVDTEDELYSTYSIRDVLDMNGMPPPQTRQIHVLVVVPYRTEDANLSQIFPTFRPYCEGINVQYPHLSRDVLVEKLYEAIIRTNFVLLSSPSGSGKTSLLTLFARKHPEISCAPIAFDGSTEDATTLLSTYGVNVYKKACDIPSGKLCVLLLDDCQRRYNDLVFWTRLIKGSASWLPDHVRFIISATHLLETDAPSSPVAFSSIQYKLTRDDFLVNDEEAYQCFNLENGLPPGLRFPTLVEVMIRECNGHIGSIRISIDAIYERFRRAGARTEEELLAFYLSGTFVEQMARCFGGEHTTPASPNQQKFLSTCLLCDRQPLVQQLSRDEHECFTRLTKAGIVTEVGGYVWFTSPLAERYYYKWLFPGRGYENPTSLHELIRKAIESMSASALKQSVVRNDDFPKEAVFQHQFMATLARHTTSTCYICPELSRVFPTSPGQPSTRIDGEIDFYLNGSLRWGIELLVNGDKIGEHMSRFAAGGKYAALAAKEYVIIDFRGNKCGISTKVARKAERITAFFKLGDFSKCRCIFGFEDEELISLKQ
ncbi:putative AAA+ ATPase domain, P-loop containing nucleoside triphosphate hydrolase [Plasmopara halstedii]